MNKYLSIVEGDGEKSICNMLKQKGYLFGRVRVLSLQEIKHIERVFRDIDTRVIVNVIIDVDTLRNNHLKVQRLLKNLTYLVENAKKVYLITENQNLEDELIRGLPNVSSEQKLFSHFSETTKKDYKARLAKMSESRVKGKLKELNYTRFWSSKILGNYTQKQSLLDINVTINDIPSN